MGYKYTGDSVLGVSLTMNTPKPLDSRTVVDSMSQLYDIPATTAYQGMTVANVSDGNIYMLVDKAKINEKAGWKASYESILIIACTEEEYNLWKQNTTEDYTPVDETLTYLHGDTYYYIYEDSINPEQLEDQSYVKYSLFSKLETSVAGKASSTDLATLRKTVDNNKEEFEKNYSTSETIAKTYTTKEYVDALIDTENEESFISNILDKYYDKNTIDSNYVTKDDLKGEADSDDYIFVTTTKYNEDQIKINTELASTLKTEEDGSVKTLTVETLKSSQDNLNIDTEELQINFEKVALFKEIPVIEVMDQSTYDEMQKAGTLKDDVFYYTHSDTLENGVVTNKILSDTCYTKSVINELILNLLNQITTLTQKITTLESYHTTE